MLWDYDLSPLAKSVLLPPPLSGKSTSKTLGWDYGNLNPDVPEGGIDLMRTTCWLMDDLEFLCKRYSIYGQYQSKEIIDLSKYPEEKWPIYEKTARDFYFKVFKPKDVEEDEGDEIISSDSDLDDIDDFDPIDGNGMIDSTISLE